MRCSRRRSIGASWRRRRCGRRWGPGSCRGGRGPWVQGWRTPSPGWTRCSMLWCGWRPPRAGGGRGGLGGIGAPEAVVRVAIERKTSADRERLGVALGRMVAADPSLRIESDGETGQTLLAGMGQLHLEIAVERLETEHRVAVTT